jgi:protease-4
MFKTKEQLLKEQLGEEGFQMLEQIKRVKSRKGIQAIMPYEIAIN